MTSSTGADDRFEDLLAVAEHSPHRLARRTRAELARGEREFEDVETGDVITKRLHAIYTSPTSRARLVRIADYVLPGDEVAEIGTGKGMVATSVARAGARRYSGIELEAVNVRQMRRILELNGVADRCSVEQGDLFDLAPGDLGTADLVICTEVIEHVPEPELALEVLAAAMPDGAELLWSVPLVGRLEQVWGHLGVFDARRIEEMCERAGLHLQHVEPVADVWALVLASRRSGRSVRAEQARSRVADLPAATEGRPRTWSNVPALEAPRVAHRSGRGVATEITEGEGALVVSVGAPMRPRSHAAGGVAFACEGVLGARLELELRTLSSARRVSVDWFSGEARIASWSWSPGWRRAVRERRDGPGRRTVVIRPGVRDRLFGDAGIDVSGADRLELTIHPRWPVPVEVGVRRIGWVR